MDPTEPPDRKPEPTLDTALAARMEARWTRRAREGFQRDVLHAVRLHVSERGDAQVTAMLLLELGAQAVVGLGYTRADVDQLVTAALGGRS